MSRNGARLFVDASLDDDTLRLDERVAHYASNVLRLGIGDEVVVFNGASTERRGRIDRLTRRGCTLTLLEQQACMPPSPVAITLIQGLIKPDRMDLIVQKTTELGITRIVVCKTDFSAVKLDAERAERKLGHWQRVAESACEQCGRHTPPQIHFHRSLADALGERPDGEQIIALNQHAAAEQPWPVAGPAGAAMIVGPEGGFSPPEHEMLHGRDCRFVRFGPRVLRAETAAIVACTIGQMRWGDLS